MGFMMVFDQETGSHKQSLSKQKSSKNPKDDSDVSVASPSEWFGPNGLDGENNPVIYTKPKFLAYTVTALILFLMIITCCLMRYRIRRRAEYDKKDSIFTYLQKFNVEDIDLRKSPPGGWHGTYLNELTHGINTATQIPANSYTDDEQEEEIDDTEILFESAQKVASRRSSAGGPSLFTSTSSKPALGGDGIYKAESSQEDTLLTNGYEDEKRPSFTIV